MSRRGYFPHGEGGGGGGVFQGMVAAAAAAVCLLVPDADIVHYISYSTWRATVWMLFRALDHRDDGMPDPRLKGGLFLLK